MGECPNCGYDDGSFAAVEDRARDAQDEATPPPAKPGSGYEELRALAEKATPGPCERTDTADYAEVTRANIMQAMVATEADASFLCVAADPQTILSLISDLDAMRDANAGMAQKVEFWQGAHDAIAKVSENRREAVIETLSRIATLEIRVDALRGERDALRSSLKDFIENPDFQVAVGGNPIKVDKMLAKARMFIFSTTNEGK